MKNRPNYFSLFGLPRDFQLTLPSLEKRYHRLQQQVHPDRFIQTTAAEQLAAVQQSAMINDAYHTLKSPLKRALYLFEQRGGNLDADSRTVNDQEFLLLQMSLRQQLEEGKNLSALATIVQKKTAQLLEQLALLFSDPKTDLSTLKAVIVKLQFFDKLQQQLYQQLGKL